MCQWTDKAVSNWPLQTRLITLIFLTIFSRYTAHRHLVKPSASPAPATGAPINSMILSADIAKGMEELQAVLRCDTSLPQPLAIKSRWCPVLQDIHGDIAETLALSEGQSSEMTLTKLSNDSSYADLQEAQSLAFMYVVGIILASDDTDMIELVEYKLKRKLGVKVGPSLALDLAKLFDFICGYDLEFPISVLSNNGSISSSSSTAVGVAVNVSSPTGCQNTSYSPCTPDHITSPLYDMPDNSQTAFHTLHLFHCMYIHVITVKLYGRQPG